MNRTKRIFIFQLLQTILLTVVMGFKNDHRVLLHTVLCVAAHLHKNVYTNESDYK